MVARGPASRPLAEINVTPFVDVMLVLLVIFMVTAPLMQQGIDINLPDTTTQPLRVNDEPLILTVREDGSVFVARKQVALEELRETLEAVLEGLDDKEIFLRADERVAYGVVAQAMAAAREAGARKLGVVTEPERP